MNKYGFLTGSRQYGKPKKDSDIDFVVQVSHGTLEKLLKIALKETQKVEHGKTMTDPGPNGAAFNFGRLNLILVTDDKSFEVWRKGTNHLTTKKASGEKITCEMAVKHFAKLRKKINNAKR